MDSGSGEIILVFASNTRILSAEDFLEERSAPFVLIPVPKEVNPNCGLAISLEEGDAEAVLKVLAEAGLLPESVYYRRGDEFSPREFPWV
ncbi:MAG: DUF3343 domain-containing protein [Deltaproteobacteria bacterium]|jgi:hypothetical protein|nr:DUF3343 domain-containing protein [Deltaproteobacteria bacterium]